MSGGASLSDPDPNVQLQDAITALMMDGNTVELDGASKRWLINGGVWVTLAQLLALAARIRLMRGPWRLQ